MRIEYQQICVIYSMLLCFSLLQPKRQRLSFCNYVFIQIKRTYKYLIKIVILVHIHKMTLYFIRKRHSLILMCQIVLQKILSLFDQFINIDNDNILIFLLNLLLLVTFIFIFQDLISYLWKLLYLCFYEI